MGKTSKWFKSFLTGKKDKEKEKNSNNQSSSTGTENPTTPMILPTTPKEKRRWSFRRSSATAAAFPRNLNSTESAAPIKPVMGCPTVNNEDQRKNHALAIAAATAAAAADAAVATAQAAAAVIRLTASAIRRASAIEEDAAIKIQSVFRAYLARKALCALKGLVKLQALVRGQLVRKQSTATLRCMQALVTVQGRSRAQRIRMTEEKPTVRHRQSVHRKSTQENRLRNAYPEIDRGMEENIKIVEMDHGESKGSSKGRNSYSSHSVTETAEHRFSARYASYHVHAKQDNYEVSPGPSASALTDTSPRACSGHFEDYTYSTAQSSPQYYSAVSKPDPSPVPFALPGTDYVECLSYDYPLYPNYMANTESSRAKVRSQSAPKARPDSFERQPSRRRASMEGRNIPRAVRMQRSSSHLGAAAQNIQYPWSMKLDRSTVSLKDSECGSTTSTMLTSTNYCRSLAAYDHHGNRY